MKTPIGTKWRKNTFHLFDDLIEEAKKRREKSGITPIHLGTIDPVYDDGGTFQYALFHNTERSKKQSRLLRLFRVKSVSNYIRGAQDHGTEFKNILNNFAENGVSFVTLNAFKPGESLLVCYGILTDVASMGTMERAVELSQQYIEALEIKFRVAYQNIEIVDLQFDDRWLFEGFYFPEVSVAKGIPKPDDAIGIRTGTSTANFTPQAGTQVGEVLLKGVTSKRTKDYAEGFPFLMYTVFDRLEKDEILVALNSVNGILGKITSSKFLSSSDGENLGMPMMVGLGFNEMFGEGVTETVGENESGSVSTSRTDTTGQSFGESMQRGSSESLATGTSEQKGSTEGVTETDGRSGGISWIGNISASEATAEQNSNSHTTGETRTETSQSSEAYGTQRSNNTSVANTEGIVESKGISRQEAVSSQKGSGDTGSGAGGVNVGETSSMTQVQFDYFFETAERIYLQYHKRIENSLRDGMFDYRFFIFTPDASSKVTVDELIKQAYTDIDAPFPIRIEPLLPEEKTELIKYARSMKKPEALEKRPALIDKRRFSTFITPSEGTAFNLPQVNMAGYLSSADPVPESIAFPGKMEAGASIGKQLNPALNMKSRYPFTFQKDSLGHMGIFSMTGQGKTVFLQRFLTEIYNQFRMNVLIFDWTTNHRGIAGNLREGGVFKYHSFKRGMGILRYNPLTTPSGVEDASWNSTITEILCHTMGLGDRSFRIIKRVLKKVKKEQKKLGEEATLADLVRGIDREFLERQEAYRQQRLTMPFNEQQTFSSIKERVSEWVEEDEITYEALCTGPFLTVEDMVTGEFVRLIECKHLPVDIRPFVINSIAAGIFHYCSSRNVKLEKPMYMVFEEAHAVLRENTGDEPLKINETIFETMNREARNYHLYLAYVCQSPEKLPDLIFDNLPIKVVLQTPSEEGKRKIVSAGGRDPLRLDVDLMKWLSRTPKGTCLIRNSNYTRVQDGEFVAVCVDPLFTSPLSDEQFGRLLERKNRVRK